MEHYYPNSGQLINLYLPWRETQSPSFRAAYYTKILEKIIWGKKAVTRQMEIQETHRELGSNDIITTTTTHIYPSDLSSISHTPNRITLLPIHGCNAPLS